MGKKKTKSEKEIDKVAVKAKKAGMSYGQYVALTEYVNCWSGRQAIMKQS